MTTTPLPEAACDCHVHVVGPPERYQMTSARRYTPGPASVSMLQAHLRQLGLQRMVIVQPSIYGTDNQCLLDSLAALEDSARGVAVLPEDVAPYVLRDMHAQGVRGIRINLESLGERDDALASPQLAHWGARIAGLGWHIQLYAAPAVIETLASQLAHLPVPVVIDHFGLPMAAHHVRVIADLLRAGNAYVKLSAPYRLASQEDAPVYAQHYLRAAVHRVLWATDWPHTARDPGRSLHEVSPYRPVSSADLLDALRKWLPTPAVRQQVLVDNPAGLYGF